MSLSRLANQRGWPFFRAARTASEHIVCRQRENHAGYPCREAAGTIFAYLGGGEPPPSQTMTCCTLLWRTRRWPSITMRATTCTISTIILILHTFHSSISSSLTASAEGTAARAQRWASLTRSYLPTLTTPWTARRQFRSSRLLMACASLQFGKRSQASVSSRGFEFIYPEHRYCPSDREWLHAAVPRADR